MVLLFEVKVVGEDVVIDVEEVVVCLYVEGKIFIM